MSYERQTGNSGLSAGAIVLITIVAVVALGLAAFMFRKYGVSDDDPSIDVCHDALGAEGLQETQVFEGENWIAFNRELEAYGLEPMVDVDNLTGDELDDIESGYRELRNRGIEVFLITVEYEDGTVGYCEVENDQEAGTNTIITAVDPV